MAITHTRPKRKVSGGKYKDYRKKRKFEIGNAPTHTKLGERKSKKVKTYGGIFKFRLLGEESVNVFDPKNKKYVKLEIKSILENPANRHFVRRGIITKGTVLETEIGKARVVNRPGQENGINAVLI